MGHLVRPLTASLTFYIFNLNLNLKVNLIHICPECHRSLNRGPDAPEQSAVQQSAAPGWEEEKLEEKEEKELEEEDEELEENEEKLQTTHGVAQLQSSKN